jgi:tetratricopeptide (TPR) repeat protein/Txe/YoeB family toxin of Txe-Axe toxin-antitoxin module
MPTVGFDNVYVSARVRVALHSILDNNHARKFWDLVNKLRSGSFESPGMRVERLHTRRGKVYSARLNIDMRVIFSMYTDASHNKRSLVFWDANHHDDAYNRIDRTVIPSIFQPGANFLEPEQIWSESDHNLDGIQEESPDEEEITNGLLLFQVPFYVLSEPERYRSFERNIDRYLRLSEEQEELLGTTDKCYLIRGAAGTGKTSLALFFALNLYEQHSQDDVYFFTYHEELACVCRCYQANLVEAEEDDDDSKGELRVFSYVAFCRHFLRQHPEVSKVSWQWIDREHSLKHLREIIGGRARWARTVQAESVYGYIYSILKGRLVPGTEKLPSSSEDFRRIFKGYGSIPANLEDLLEIFGHYEERLHRAKQKDEADLIRYCYQTFKDKAVLSTERPTWLVIDELQDFTELEWKSLLLFWENQCQDGSNRITYPFLCGDRNQNISQSGFRWQEVDSYVESTLRSIHRSASLEKVQLHRNFRNTKQIFDLGVFIHSLAPQAGSDLGLPPDTEGRLPRLVVGSEDEFMQFLRLLHDPSPTELPAPLVILSEDSRSVDRIQEQLLEDDELFFMPLKSSKGLEFEDLIIYRLFGSLQDVDPEHWNEEDQQRCFDLWYMAIMRARQNLLIYLTHEDLERLETLLGKHYAEFLPLVEVQDVQAGGAQLQLLSFHHSRERYLPNYAIIFLERTKANEIWQQYRQLENKGKQDPRLRAAAFKLWHRCRDVESIGRAHVELGEYKEAIPFLQQASLHAEAGACFERLGKYETAARLFEQEGELEKAGRCYEKCKQYRLAAEIFERMEKWLQAATNYYLFGDNAKAAMCFEEAKMWQSAADLYKLRSNWGKAAELYQKCEQFELAAEMYLKLKDKLDAARCFSRAELPEKAAPLFEALMRWAQAAQSYEQAGQWQKAGALYSKAGRLKDAARCKEQAGDLSSAANAYERMRNWHKAAEAYLALKQSARAAECFENDNNWRAALNVWQELARWPEAARCLEKLGQFHEAAQVCAQAGLHNDAGHFYERQQEWAEAADQYLKVKNFSAAASMLSRLDRRLDAARLYLLAGQAPVAVEVLSAQGGKQKNADGKLSDLITWVEESGRKDLAAALFDATGDCERAIDNYKQCMRLDKAAECAEKNQQFELAGDFYLQDGKFENAAKCFKLARQPKRAALCYEMLKNWSEARKLYEELNDLEGIQRCETAANWL